MKRANNSTEMVGLGGGVQIPMYEIQRMLAISSLEEGIQDEVEQRRIMRCELEGMLRLPCMAALTDFIMAYKMVFKCREILERLDTTSEIVTEYETLKKGYVAIEKATFDHSVGAELGITYNEYKKMGKEEIELLVRETYHG